LWSQTYNNYVTGLLVGDQGSDLNASNLYDTGVGSKIVINAGLFNTSGQFKGSNVIFKMTPAVGPAYKGGLAWGYVNGTANTNAWAAIQVECTSATGNGYGDMYFMTRNVTTDTTPTTRITLKSSGETLFGTATLTTPSALGTGGDGIISAANTFAFKNRIINGAFNVRQYTVASISGTGNCSGYAVDRWIGAGSGGASPSILLSTASTTLPAPQSGVAQFALTVTSNASSIVNIYAAQRIEVNNVADLANSTITVGFYAATSASATITVRLYYPNTTADTWQAVGSTTVFTNGATSAGGVTQATTATLTYYSVTFSTASSNGPLCTRGMMLVFDCPTTASSQTMTITGVQLEKGTAATPFDYRSFVEELCLCQRYRLVDTNASAAYRPFGVGYATNTTTASVARFFPVTMRTSPSVTANTATGFIADQGAFSAASTSVTDTGGASPNAARITIAVASGLSSAGAVMLVSDNTSSLRTITYSSEL
jgi:hypothetical protein